MAKDYFYESQKGSDDDEAEEFVPGSSAAVEVKF